MAEVRRSAPALEVRGLDVYYGHSHALQGVDLTLDSGVFSVVGRNGMGKTTLCKTIMGLLRASGGSVRIRGEDITRLSPARIAQARRRLCSAGATAVALAQRRRAFAPRRRDAARRLDHRSHLRDVSPPCRTQGPRRRPALGRRAADAGDLARASDQPAAAHHGRADRGARARHRRPGRGDAGAPRRRRRHGGARHRAEYRRRHRDLEERRDHGQRPDQPHHRLRAPCGRPRTAAAPAWRRASMPSRKPISKPPMRVPRPRRVPHRRAPRARRRSGSTSPIPRCRRAGRSRPPSRASRPPRARCRPALRGSKTPPGKSARPARPYKARPDRPSSLSPARSIPRARNCASFAT